MQSRYLLDKSKCLTVPCQLSIRNYVKNKPNNQPQFEIWEYDNILKQTLDFDENVFCPAIEDKEDYNESTESIMELVAGGSEWQQQHWDKVIDNESIKSTITYCLPKLSDDIFARSFPLAGDIQAFPLRIGKPLARRTVLDYYPTKVHQNELFLTPDRRFFPLVFHDTAGVSHQLGQLPPHVFHSIRNGVPDSDIVLDRRAGNGRIVVYETSEQHSPFRMQPLLTSQLAAYAAGARNLESPLGVPRQIQRKSPFLGALCDTTAYQLAIENGYFRVPVWCHRMRSTDFLLRISGESISVVPLDEALLAGKQMPLVPIYNPKSVFFRKAMMRVVCQLFLDSEVVSVELLAGILSNIDFLNIEGELQKIAVLSNDKRSWRLRAPLTASDGFYGNMDSDEYMVWAAIASYLNCYEYVRLEGKQALKKNIKAEKKKHQGRNPFSPWSISKAYLNGLHKGFWKLDNFKEPTRKNQMDSFKYVATLVSKRFFNEKTDLRKLTVHETYRLLKKFQSLANDSNGGNRNSKRKKQKRWDLVKDLTTQAATDLGGNTDMEKYARDTKTNRRNIVTLEPIRNAQTLTRSWGNH